jgi:hypothetical protein
MRIARNLWTDKNSSLNLSWPQDQRIFFDKLASRLKLERPEDWYSVNSETVIKNGGEFVKTFYNGSHLQGTIDIRSNSICICDYLCNRISI